MYEKTQVLPNTEKSEPDWSKEELDLNKNDHRMVLPDSSSILSILWLFYNFFWFVDT